VGLSVAGRLAVGPGARQPAGARWSSPATGRQGLTGRQPIVETTKIYHFSQLSSWQLKAREKKNGEEIVIE